MQSQTSFPGKPKLLDQLRTFMRARRYSLRTEEAYLDWIRRFILFHGKRHPRDLGEREITEFLTGYDIRTVQELLGHSPREITKAHAKALLRLCLAFANGPSVLCWVDEGFAQASATA